MENYTPNDMQNEVQTEASQKPEDVTNSPGNKIIATILSAAIIGLVGIMLLSDYIFPNGMNVLDILIAMGFIFFLIGGGSIIVSRTSENKKSDFFGGIICLLIGAFMAGIPLYIKYGSNVNLEQVLLIVIYVCAGAFLLAGMAILLFLYWMTLYRIPRCTLEIEAQVNDIDMRRSDMNKLDSVVGNSSGVKVSVRSRKMMSAYSFVFTYGGQEYIVKDPMYYGGLFADEFQVGDTVLIKINPLKPKEFYRYRPGAFVTTGILGVGGLFAGIIILLLI